MIKKKITNLDRVKKSVNKLKSGTNQKGSTTTTSMKSFGSNAIEDADGVEVHPSVSRKRRHDQNTTSDTFKKSDKILKSGALPNIDGKCVVFNDADKGIIPRNLFTSQVANRTNKRNQFGSKIPTNKSFVSNGINNGNDEYDGERKLEKLVAQCNVYNKKG